mgnify:CR=1 FL=1
MALMRGADAGRGVGMMAWHRGVASAWRRHGDSVAWHGDSVVWRTMMTA